MKNFFVAAGFNSSGIASGAGAGKALSEWLVQVNLNQIKEKIVLVLMIIFVNPGLPHDGSLASGHTTLWTLPCKR